MITPTTRFIYSIVLFYVYRVSKKTLHLTVFCSLKEPCDDATSGNMAPIPDLDMPIKDTLTGSVPFCPSLVTVVSTLSVPNTDCFWI
jgi:hypothetical protein